MQKQIAKWFTGAALAAALLVAAPHQAQAQQIAFGVQVGGYPVYGYSHGYGYNEIARQRWIEHQQWEVARAAEWRHEQWERQRFLDHAYDHDGWRGRYEHRDWR